MKRLISGVLCVAMMLCAMVFTQANAEAATSGVTGSCKWSLDGTVLTISGNGEMDSHGLYTPWGKEITHVVIEYGVTNISETAFYECSKLQSVSIPGSVKQIDRLAFGYTGLTSVVLPEGLTTIGDAAFHHNPSLRSVVLPNSLTHIGNYAFQSCRMSSIVIPKNVKYIGDYAFNYCRIDDVWYVGSKEDKAEIYIGGYNATLNTATWHYDSCPIGAPHSYDNDCDPDCNNCGDLRSTQHHYAADCAWCCSSCGARRKETDAVHTLGEGAICTLCGEQGRYIGDVTGDCKVNMGDAARLYAHIRGTRLIEDLTELVIADVTGDGKVNMGDTARILSHAKGNNPLF